MNRRIAADVAGVALSVAAGALVVGAWAWAVATRLVRWTGTLTEGPRR